MQLAGGHPNLAGSKAVGLEVIKQRKMVFNADEKQVASLCRLAKLWNDLADCISHQLNLLKS